MFQRGQHSSLPLTTTIVWILDVGFWILDDFSDKVKDGGDKESGSSSTQGNRVSRE